MMNRAEKMRIAVVIPTYKAKREILGVISAIGAEVIRVYVVDDCCPENTGKYVEENCKDPRVQVIHCVTNQGVGGAVMTGYAAALEHGMDILIKIDSDGQMDPALIPEFADPIINREADYTKGNRFFDIEKVSSMPRLRLIGNAVLSFLNKMSSGYWNLFDPTNGYTAIHADVARRLPFDKISQRYFFETDMLFRLNTLHAVVVDVPMEAKYGNETSHLRISRIIGEFLLKHLRNTCKRIIYNYYLRDVSVASIELPLGLGLFIFGVIYGAHRWVESGGQGIPTPSGSVMLAALPIIIGLQMVLSFLSYDIASVPRRPIHRHKRAKE